MKIQTHYLSYILVIVSHNIFISGFIFANQSGLHPIQTNFLRGIATFIINFCLIKYYQLGMEFKLASNHKYLLIRSGSICLHSLTLALSGFYLPQPVIHTINCSGPIFVIIQDYFLNSVRINNQQLKGIVFTFIGITLTINGEHIVKYYFDDVEQLSLNSTFQNYASNNSVQKIMMGALMTFMASIWAYGTIVVKNIVQINSIHINLHFGIFVTIVSGLLYPVFVAQPKPVYTMFLGLILSGVPMALGNILYIHALTINKNTGLTTLCISSSVFVGYMISIFRYNESINYICIIGSLCIVCGLIVALTSKRESDSDRSTTEQLLANKFKQIQLSEVFDKNQHSKGENPEKKQ